MGYRPFAFIILFLIALMPVAAQRDLCADGELLAHDVMRTGQQPPALRALLKGRELTEREVPLRGTKRMAAIPPSRMKQKGWATQALQQKRQATDSMLKNPFCWQTPATDAPAEVSAVEPLLRSVRDQEAPYNLLCPQWTYDDGSVSEERCLSGCVATAIEQVMAYYRYPLALQDTLHGWATDNYTIEDLLPGTRFDWENYLLDYRNGWTAEQGSAIALVSLACGMAVHMNYGLYSSGAYTGNAVEALKSAFGYGMVKYVDRVIYTPRQWHAIIRHELANGRPLVYTGHNMELNGHAFNIDGYDEQGYYHVNWGYNGSYDGWYDLDWLNPWEPVDMQDIPEGFFCNQSLLLMHPSSEVKPLETDTLELDHLGVELQQVQFERSPDLQGLIAADFLFHNGGDAPVTYTYEVMTYLPTDTAIFEQADYVGLSAVNLSPGETRTQRVYLSFHEKGDRILGISHDDVTIPYTQNVSITEGTAAILEWGSPEVDVQPQADGTCHATFSVPVANKAASGFAGSLVTLCLTPAASDEERRHWWVLSLPGGSEEVRTVTFKNLQPETQYVFRLRCPWTVQQECTFWTTVPTGIDGISSAHDSSGSAVYDLSGRRIEPREGTIFIKNGKKWLQR
ncbi:MAG: C10 family peptidase [Bacteroidales bacterium]|nr:C10 family peptidase [Bacteroidales bacterium]